MRIREKAGDKLWRRSWIRLWQNKNHKNKNHNNKNYNRSCNGSYNRSYSGNYSKNYIIRKRGTSPNSRRGWQAAILSAVMVFIVSLSDTVSLPVQAEETNLDLYARGAVLMDAGSGRVLYGKAEDVALPMASTTKIMTCILALERGNMEDEVEASSHAASQPQVHLGMKSGESFLLKDLLYSLMLESHNDSAVAVAEHIGGSVEGFAKLMNEKAEEIGCTDTHFITPNGLDATEMINGKEYRHSTTARDLALIMRYCIMQSPKKEEFLEITRTANYGFSNRQGTRSYSCTNHNAFLNMMDGALSGKTGFTGGAGYCYVGALRRDDRTFIVALLACGWPNHKTYKWADTRKLMEYGLANYEYRNIYKELEFKPVIISEGMPEGEKCDPYAEVTAEVEMQETEEGKTEKGKTEEGKTEEGKTEEEKMGVELPEEELNFLLCEKDEVKVDVSYAGELEAPVEAGEKIGEAVYYVNEEPVKSYDLVLKSEVKRKDWKYMGKYILQEYLLQAG